MVIRVEKKNFKEKLKTKTTHLIRGQVQLPDGRVVKRNKCGNVLPLGEFRAGRKIRTHATSILSRAYLEDVLTPDEYHERFVAATKAVTETELKELLHDLPERVFSPIHTSENFLTENFPTPHHAPTSLWKLPQGKGSELAHKVREETQTILRQAFNEEMFTTEELNERLWLSQTMMKPENFATLLTDIPDYINTFNSKKYVTTTVNHRKPRNPLPKNFTTLFVSTAAIVVALTVDIEPVVEKLPLIVTNLHN